MLSPKDVEWLDVLALGERVFQNVDLTGKKSDSCLVHGGGSGVWGWGAVAWTFATSLISL